MADNYFVTDEDLHVLCELEKLLSLNFSGCAEIEDEGLAVSCFYTFFVCLGCVYSSCWDIRTQPRVQNMFALI